MLHPKCDCSLRYIDYSQVERNAKAECSIDKFENYIFVEKSKKSIFENLGYKIQDSAYLVDIFKNQAVKQYLKGNYKLKKLDRYGQRLAIPIILKEKSFYSGWMLQPEGELVNTTPFGGKINEK